LFDKFKKKSNKFSLACHLILFKSEKFINLRSLKIDRAEACLASRFSWLERWIHIRLRRTGVQKAKEE